MLSCQVGVRRARVEQGRCVFSCLQGYPTSAYLPTGPGCQFGTIVSQAAHFCCDMAAAVVAAAAAGHQRDSRQGRWWCAGRRAAHQQRQEHRALRCTAAQAGRAHRQQEGAMSGVAADAVCSASMCWHLLASWDAVFCACVLCVPMHNPSDEVLESRDADWSLGTHWASHHPLAAARSMVGCYRPWRLQ